LPVPAQEQAWRTPDQKGAHAHEYRARARQDHDGRNRKTPQLDRGSPYRRKTRHREQEGGSVSSPEPSPREAGHAQGQPRHQEKVHRQSCKRPPRDADDPPPRADPGTDDDQDRVDELPPGATIDGPGRTGDRVAHLVARAEQHADAEHLERHDGRAPFAAECYPDHLRREQDQRGTGRQHQQGNQGDSAAVGRAEPGQVVLDFGHCREQHLIQHGAEGVGGR
jgi:hypothetical protein